MARFKLFGRKENRSEETISELVSIDEQTLGQLLSGDWMTRKTAMEIPAFAACVNLICDTIAIIPINLYKTEGDSTKTIDDDPRTRLLNEDTKDTLTGSDFKKALMFDYLTGKGGYAFINKKRNAFRSIHYVDCEDVSFLEGTDKIFKDYKIIVNGQQFEGHQFLKVLRRTKNGYEGLSVVKENQAILETAYRTLLFERKNLKNGGVKKGFAETDRVLSDPAAKELKKTINEAYNSDKDRVLVLNGVKFHEASATPTELQINENKKANAEDIYSIMQIPPRIMTGGATEDDWNEYIQYCIIPKLQALCDALNRDLLLENEKKNMNFAPDIYELTKGDIKKRFDAYQVAYKNGFMQIDEIREKEKLPAVGNPFVKMGLADVLYDPETGVLYIPNTNQSVCLKDVMDHPELALRPGEEISPNGSVMSKKQIEDLIGDKEKEKEQEEDNKEEQGKNENQDKS